MEEKDKARSEATFRFILPNFSRLKETAFSLPVFVKNLPWRILVMPRMYHEDGRIPIKTLGLFLECNNHSESKTWSCTALADLRLISRKDCVVNFTRKIRHTFYHEEPDWGFSSFIQWNEVLDPKNGYIKDDTIILEVNVVVDAPDEVGEKQTLPSTSEADNLRLTELDVLSENLKDLFANKDSCDTVLEVKDKEFKVHKAILMGRSPVFAAMFQHDTLEKQTGFVKIPDCDPESFQEFLDYLYCGKLEDISYRSAFQLYITSSKYDVQKLKDFCVECLAQNFTVVNMCDIVIMADKYSDEKLMAAAQHFFNENWSKIFVTTEWKSLLKSDYRLVDKLLTDLSKAKGSH